MAIATMAIFYDLQHHCQDTFSLSHTVDKGTLEVHSRSSSLGFSKVILSPRVGECSLCLVLSLPSSRAGSIPTETDLRLFDSVHDWVKKRCMKLHLFLSAHSGPLQASVFADLQAAKDEIKQLNAALTNAVAEKDALKNQVTQLEERYAQSRSDLKSISAEKAKAAAKAAEDLSAEKEKAAEALAAEKAKAAEELAVEKAKAAKELAAEKAKAAEELAAEKAKGAEALNAIEKDMNAVVEGLKGLESEPQSKPVLAALTAGDLRSMESGHCILIQWPGSCGPLSYAVVRDQSGAYVSLRSDRRTWHWLEDIAAEISSSQLRIVRELREGGQPRRIKLADEKVASGQRYAQNQAKRARPW